MFQDTRPVPLDGYDDEDPQLAEFRVSDPTEVRALLRSLLNQTVPLNLSASDGSGYRTTLWTIDAEGGRVMFTADMMDPNVHNIIEADEAVAVAYLDKIKLQWDVVDLMLVQGQRASVLQARMPRELFRFQRRNAFRVRTIERTQPTATMRHPGLPDMTLQLRVLDVSIGGCALLMPGNAPMMPAGVLVGGVRLTLDSETSFDTSLMVHHVTSTGAENGSVRLGCGIVGLVGNAERALQRYIDQTQKRRRMMALD
jgi:c-di-GMP-binding flagellar brake protein YcgR